MIFNEILIPQDFFTETNVTRKKVCRRKFVTTFQNCFIFFNLPNYLLLVPNLQKKKPKKKKKKKKKFKRIKERKGRQINRGHYTS